MMNAKMTHVVLVLGMVFLDFGARATPAEWSFDYFGEEPPGLEMKRFNPHIPGLETGELERLIFTPDGKACYFIMKTGDVSQVYLRQEKDGLWSQPAPVHFPDEWTSIHAFSPDGKRLYFSAGRTVYVRTRTDDGWSGAQALPEPVNFDKSVIGIAVGTREDLYFCSWRKPGQGKCDLWVAQRVNGVFPKVESLSSLNTPTSECSVMLGPGDCCLVFYSWRPGGHGQADLYVSLPDETGGWAAPRNLGPRVNTKEGEVPMTFSPDGQYMFFYRAGKPYWIATRAVIPGISSNLTREKIRSD